MKTNEKKISGAALTRIIGLGTSVVGFLMIFIIKAILDRKFDKFFVSNGYAPTSCDNFYLYFDLSTFLTAVLLGLTLISVATYVFQKGKKSRFAYLTVTISPILCSVALIMVSVFYSYLTHGTEYVIWPHIVLLSIAESMLFALPFTLTKAHKMSQESLTENVKTKK